jgi:hypothetical protein
MIYKFLLAQLWTVADEAAVFLKREWGVTGLKAEVAPFTEITLLPTFRATMPDHHTLWVEVSDRPYPPHLDSIVSDCMLHGLPVRIVVAVSADRKGNQFHEDLARAKKKGVGVVAMNGTRGEWLTNSISQSLTGVHRIARQEFPAKFRFPLSQAELTFLQGDPAKGCDAIYGITEDISRKAAEATFNKGFWRPGSAPPKHFDRDPWDTVMNSLVRNLDPVQYKHFGDNILHRIIGITPYRNKVAHVPKNNKDLRRRDQTLRTRFEDAADILHELIKDVKPLNI